MRMWLCLAVVGCAGDANVIRDADTGGFASGDGAADGGATGGDTGPGEQWWRVDADLVVAAGAVEAASSTLSLSLVGDEGTVCTDVVTPLSAVEADAPHASVYDWWELSWDPASLSCFESGGPTAGQLDLGIGALDPEIRALLGRLDDVIADAAAGTLNGAYASLPGDERLFVFGAAGLPDAWTGEGTAATEAPLPDGTWRVRAVYSFEL